MDLRSLADTWLPVPDVAEVLRLSARDVRNMIRDKRLIGCRIEGFEGYRVPSAFLDADEHEPIDGLAGSITQLLDGGMTEEQVVGWLLTPHDELGRTPAAALSAGMKHAVRRAALSEAL